MDKIFDVIDNYISKNKAFEIVEILDSSGSTPRTSKTFMIVDSDKNTFGTIGGGTVEFIATKDAYEFLKYKKSENKSYHLTVGDGANVLGMVCGGDVSVKFTYVNELNDEIKKYIEELKNYFKDISKYYIFGAGHVGKSLSKYLTELNLDVTVYDDREQYASINNLSKDVKIICKPFGELLKWTDIKEDDYVIILTSGHKGDFEVLKNVLKTKAYYIGCIGSTNKISTINEMLLQTGFSKDDIKRIKAPIGIQVGAESVDEIAISITCELILYKSVKENRRKVVENKTIYRRLDEYTF